MIPSGTPPHKDKTEASFVPPPPPGDDLARKIADLGRHHGRPVWNLGARPTDPTDADRGPDRRPDNLGGLVVPRLKPPISDIGAHGKSGRYVLFGEEPRAVLHHRVALALETQHPAALGELSAADHTQWRQLGAAALRDLLALDDGEIAKHCGYKDAVRSSGRRAVAQGRELLARLDAWPWWYFGPDGRPPANWHARGGDLRVNVGFATWATGALLHAGSFDIGT